MNFLDPRLPDRFWEKCIPEPNSGCWLWHSTLSSGESPTFSVGNLNIAAHVVTFIKANGQIPDGYWLRKTCRIRACVNPAHHVATNEGKHRTGSSRQANTKPENVKRRRKRVVRSKTIAIKRLSREELRVGAISYPPVDVERPRVRRDCRPGGCNEERPCPFVSCTHHLYLDVTEAGGIKINFPDLEPWELRETCALDVAERGGVTLEEVGKIMNLTRERIRQIEVRGLLKIKASPIKEAA